jgi:hypothetical protein
MERRGKKNQERKESTPKFFHLVTRENVYSTTLRKDDPINEFKTLLALFSTCGSTSKRRI